MVASDSSGQKWHIDTLCKVRPGRMVEADDALVGALPDLEPEGCRCVLVVDVEDSVEVRRTWKSVLDDETCDSCRERDGKVFLPPFSDQDMPPAGCENLEVD